MVRFKHVFNANPKTQEPTISVTTLERVCCCLPVMQIQGCDAILARMQEMLLGFQADLGGISDEIKHLQVQNGTKLVMSEGRTYVLILRSMI